MTVPVSDLKAKDRQPRLDPVRDGRNPLGAAVVVAALAYALALAGMAAEEIVQVLSQVTALVALYVAHGTRRNL